MPGFYHAIIDGATIGILLAAAGRYIKAHYELASLISLKETLQSEINEMGSRLEEELSQLKK